MNREINDEILQRYWAGAATVYEKEAIKAWLKEPVNQEYFYQCLVRWEQQNPQFLPDVDEAISRHFIRMNEEAANEEEDFTSEGSMVWGKWMAAAAVLFIAGWIGWLQRDLIRYQTIQTQVGEKRSLQLEDGSLVRLHENSQLRIPRFGFGQRTREVFLKGEADFEVRHTPNDQPFLVKTDRQLEVLVLGTEFTVVSRAQRSKVWLNKGKVQLRYLQGPVVKEILMKPGELVVVEGKSSVVQQLATEPVKARQVLEHRFVLEETTLQELCRLFTEQWGMKVTVVDDSLAAWTVTGSFSAASPEEMLETITEAANLKYRKDAQGILLFVE